MKATLVPVYFKSGMDDEFRKHLALVQTLLADEVELLQPVALGRKLPPADAVVFPQLTGDAFSQLKDLKAIRDPITCSIPDRIAETARS
jgi:hypothetical protein